MKEKMVFCNWAGEKVEKAGHNKKSDCICIACDFCGKKFKKNDRWILDNNYLHKDCLFRWLKEQGIIEKGRG